MARHRTKLCDRCTQSALILYRVQWDKSGRWQWVCDSCQPSISQNNPNYIYGGTWKAKKPS